MLAKELLAGLMALAVVAEGSVLHRSSPIEAALARRQNRGGNKSGNNGGNNNGASQTCLAANALQTGSESTGQVNGVAADGQVNSATDNANFINFCSGETLTNGLQVKTGSCNGIVMGKIPAQAKMVSTVIVNPKHNDVLQGFQTFDIQLKVNNLDAGHFTNATSTYYSAPQDVNGQGIVIGHTHVTVQDLGGSFNPQTPLDSTKFAFFKGINTAANGQGILSATVTGGLPDGFYRLCTMSAASNHQPVLMPVAQRGTPDDCTKFQVKGGQAPPASASSSAASSAATASSGNNKGNTGSNNNNNNNNNKGNTGGNNNNNNNNNKGNTGGNNNNNNNNKGNTGGNNNKAQSTTSAAAAAATSKAASTGGNNNKGSTGGNTNNAAKGGSSASSALGGIAAPSVTKSSDSKRPFSVNGDTFVNESAAVQRACDIQNNLCANAVNGGKLSGVTVMQCSDQIATCVQTLKVS